MMTVKEKIDWEYEMFYLDMMRTSRENIFTKSKEIQKKKEIHQQVTTLCKSLNPKEQMILLCKENIIDMVYRNVGGKAITYKLVTEEVASMMTKGDVKILYDAKKG